MKRTFYFLFLAMAIVFYTPAITYALPNKAAAPEKTEMLSKKDMKEMKKAERQEKRAERKQQRKARFLAWMASAGSGDDGIVAAIICFFIGWLGIHRVYLGGKGSLILLYFITFGGIFGLLPLIDFIRLLIGDVGHYTNNDDFFAAFK